MSFMNVPLDTAIQRAMNFRNAKKGFQVAIEYIAEQVLTHGNADAIGQIFRAAELIANEKGKAVVTKTGSAVWQYLAHEPEKGGLGFGELVRWDKDTSAFKMVKGWQAIAEELDMGLVFSNLKTRLWYLHQTVPAENAFDLSKSLKALIKKAEKAGVSRVELAHVLAGEVPEVWALERPSINALVKREPVAEEVAKAA